MAGEGQQPGNGCRLLFLAVQQEHMQEEEQQQQAFHWLVHFFQAHHEEHGLPSSWHQYGLGFVGELQVGCPGLAIRTIVQWS